MLNTEKEFDFRNRKQEPQKQKSGLGAAFFFVCFTLVFYNGTSLYQMSQRSATLTQKAAVAQGQYEAIIAKLNSHKIGKQNFSAELLKELNQLVDNNLVIADSYATDIMFQLAQDRKISSSVKDDIFKEYAKIENKGRESQDRLGSCLLDLPCFMQKLEEDSVRVKVETEISAKKELAKAYRQTENFQPPQLRESELNAAK